MHMLASCLAAVPDGYVVPGLAFLHGFVVVRLQLDQGLEHSLHARVRVGV